MTKNLPWPPLPMTETPPMPPPSPQQRTLERMRRGVEGTNAI